MQGLFEKFEAEMRKNAQTKVAASQTLAQLTPTVSRDFNGQPGSKSSLASDQSEEIQNDEKTARRSKAKVGQSAPKSRGSGERPAEESVKGSKSRRKGKTKGANSMKDEGQPDLSDSGRVILEGEGDVPSLEAMTETVLEWYPDMEIAGAGSCHRLPSSLSSHSLPGSITAVVMC